jgi:toxin ParE1/3/4
VSFAIRLSPLAIDDIIALHRWTAREAGTEIADGYLGRIETRIAGLADFPHRGALRDDLAPGLRTLSFERSLLIAYRVDAADVTILRVATRCANLRRCSETDRASASRSD